MKNLLVIPLLFALAGTAAADPEITINRCVMGYVTKGSDDLIGYGLDFTNNTHHVVTAVRINFIFETPFNEVLGNTLETDAGVFTPGVEIDHTERDTTAASAMNGASIGSIFGHRGAIKEPYWQVKNPSQESIGSMKVACELDAVSFQDGTVWTAPQKQ